MIIDSPIVSGSASASGSLNQHGDIVITGSLTVTGPITGALTGSVDSASFASTAISSSYAASATSASYAISATSSSYANDATSASYAVNTSFLNGSGSGEFTPTGSFNAFSSSILTYTGSNDTNISNIHSTTASLNTASGSAITRLNSIESTTGSLNVASGSAITRLNALEVTSGSNITRISALEVASGSAITRLNALEVTSGSNITRISALESASGSAITRLNSIESTTGSLNIFSGSAQSQLTSLQAQTGSYATTGSNTFVDTQYVSASNNAVGFTSTASLYTDGGLRVAKDAYVSGTLYLNNVTVFGTQSISYITSSQLNISTNLITVNTDTPAVRFGGLAVYDSGSTGLTGSLLWDSENNHWVYSNPSGSTYSGGMFISGPRTATLGSEQGTTACRVLVGQGGDHLTSSLIYHDSATTCIPNTLIGSTVCSIMANTSCIGIGTQTPVHPLDIINSGGTGISTRNAETDYSILRIGTDTGNGYSFIQSGKSGTGTTLPLAFRFDSNEVARVTNTGVTCFCNTICAPSSRICSTGDLSYIYNSGASTTDANFYIYNSTSDILMVRNSGCVGLNISNPQARLDIAGNNNALGCANTLRFTDTDTATELNQQIGKIEFYSSDISAPGAGVKAYIGAFAQDTTPDAYIA
jgi:hypothetical protein